MARNDLQGSLDLLVLKTLSQTGKLHGYGIVLHIQRASAELLRIEEGSLYPALHRMEENDWIDASPGSRAMCAAALDGDAESIRARHVPTGSIKDCTRRAGRRDVQPENGFWLGILQSTFLDHQARPTLFAPGRPFLSRLEDELHGAG